MVSARSSLRLQGAGDAAGDGGDFDGVGQAGAQMIAGAVEEDLGLVFQAAEGAGMDDAVAVALVFGAPQGRGSGWTRPRDSALSWA